MELNGRKRARITYSRQQLIALEQSFAQDEYPNLTKRKHLASVLHITTANVQIWFQNRRAKKRRALALARQVSCMELNSNISSNGNQFYNVHHQRPLDEHSHMNSYTDITLTDNFNSCQQMSGYISNDLVNLDEINQIFDDYGYQLDPFM